MKPRVAWIAMGIALALHLLLGVGQSQGWIPGETRWLGVGAVRRSWRVESILGSIDGLRNVGRRWLEEAETLPMDHNEFLNQHSRAWSRLSRSLEPDVRFEVRRDAEDRWITTPAIDRPFRRYYAADGRFQSAVGRFYEADSRGDLAECRSAWKDLERSLDELRSTVEHDR